MADTVEYRNPIATGFNPDPSVVHIDGIFYMATSTFQVFPGIPIHASTNLRDWRLIGHAINRTTQLSLLHAHSRLVTLDTGHGMIATGGLQAPTIRFHEGKFYVVGTNMVRQEDGTLLREQFIVSTSDIWKDEWSDPVTFDFHGFDTSFFVDDDGRVYIQGAWVTDQRKQPLSVIYQLEINLDTGRIVTPARLIWEGHFRYDTEGPHIYKRGSWYYLIAAEGGTFEHHKLSIARSRDIWGPYESYEKNPILTADGTGEYIQGLGHGELFQDSNSEWWVAALGFRTVNGIWPLGRETFLAKATWPEGGWPQIEQPRASFRAKRVRETAALPSFESVSDLVHLRGRQDANYHITRAGGGDSSVILLRPSRVTLDAAHGTPTFIGKRQHEMSAAARVTLDIAGFTPGEEVVAGLAVYLDPLRYAYLAFDFGISKLYFHVVSVTSPSPRTTSYDLDARTTSLELKVDASAKEYVFSFSQLTNASQTEWRWQVAGSVTTADLFVRFFTGPLFGIFAQGEALTGSGVTFRDFTTVAPGPQDSFKLAPKSIL